MPGKRNSNKKSKANSTDELSKAGNGLGSLLKELWEAAVTLRGSIEPADYKRYVLPIIFLRFLSMRFEKRREDLERLLADPQSDYFTDNPEEIRRTLEDPDEYRSANVFIVPEKARWDYLRSNAQADDIKVKLDDVLESAGETVSGQVERSSCRYLRWLEPSRQRPPG